MFVYLILVGVVYVLTRVLCSPDQPQNTIHKHDIRELCVFAHFLIFCSWWWAQVIMSTLHLRLCYCSFQLYIQHICHGHITPRHVLSDRSLVTFWITIWLIVIDLASGNITTERIVCDSKLVLPNMHVIMQITVWWPNILLVYVDIVIFLLDCKFAYDLFSINIVVDVLP